MKKQKDCELTICKSRVQLIIILKISTGAYYVVIKIDFDLQPPLHLVASNIQIQTAKIYGYNLSHHLTSICNSVILAKSLRNTTVLDNVSQFWDSLADIDL